jgi:endoglucanase
VPLRPPVWLTLKCLLLAFAFTVLLPVAAASARVGISDNIAVSGSAAHGTESSGDGTSQEGVSGEPSPTQPSGPSVESQTVTAAPGFSIAVSGNHFVDSTGKTITLHGVNIDGQEWQCLYGQPFYGPSDDASIAAIASWHVNAVRIPLNEDCWLGINGAPTDIGPYHEAIRDYVNRLHAHGLYAILDLHWSAPGSIISHLGQNFSGFFGMADADHSPDFWSSIASYFKEDNAVLFDLFNEPNGISWDCWLNGCMSPRGFQTAGMQQLVDAVRQTGAKQPVMVGGLEFAGELGQAWLAHRPHDPANQLVASSHTYGQSNYATNIGQVAEEFPVVVGEVGELDCGHNYLDTFLPWADSHGVSYVAWAWFVGSCAAYPSLISDYGGTPTNFGVGYRDHLLATFPAPKNDFVESR